MTLLLQADENGTLMLPAELFAYFQPNAQYTVEQQAQTLIVRPVTPESETKQAEADAKRADWDAWWAEWLALTEKMGQAPTTGVSALEALSEMRR